MPKKRTRKSAFAHFGVECSNPVWSWSGKSPDGEVVVVTIWQDEIKHENGKVIFAARGKGQAEKRLGALERILNLKWAQEHCDGRLRVVMVVAKDIKAIPREAIDWFPDEKLILKITELNETTGAFRAEQVD